MLGKLIKYVERTKVYIRLQKTPIYIGDEFISAFTSGESDISDERHQHFVLRRPADIKRIHTFEG